MAIPVSTFKLDEHLNLGAYYVASNRRQGIHRRFLRTTLTHPCLIARHFLLLAGLHRVAVVVEIALLEVAQDLLAVDGVEKVLR